MFFYFASTWALDAPLQSKKAVSADCTYGIPPTRGVQSKNAVSAHIRLSSLFWSSCLRLTAQFVHWNRAHISAIHTGIVAKFRKLGGKVSLTEKIHTSSKNRNYIHQMVLSLWNHWQSKNSISSKGFVAKTTKNDIASFLLESSQDSLVQNQDGFRQPHLQTYFHGNYTYHPLFKDQHLAFPASYTPETWLFFLHPTP